MQLQFISRAVGAAKLALKAKAPTLLVVGGVASMGVGTVIAAKKTLEIDSVLERHVNDLEKISYGQSLNLPSYGKEVALGDRFKVYSSVGVDLVRLYFIPGVFWVGGATMVFAGHRVMLQRNATLTVALSGVMQAFDAYRDRVRNHMGNDFDQAMLHGYKMDEVLDSETGTPQLVPTRDWDAEHVDPYNRIFGQGETSAWRNDLGLNKMFLAQQREFAQQLLNRRGYLYLSDVYDALGFPNSDTAQVVGWKVERLPDGSRNIPTVDFGLDRPMPDDWKYSRENAVYLDFNCKLIVGGRIQKILENAK